MESREQGYEDHRFQSDVSQNLHCVICLNVFKDPVMCQRNQHCFCRPCITKHLVNSQTCPTCMEELTLETLNQAPRILKDWLSELNIRCEYFNRGCREFVQLADLETHVKNCGYSPVMCSNQGCLVEINKQDRTLHETEICEFRKVKCHDCVEVRKEIGEVKIHLMTLAEKLEGVDRNQTAMNTEVAEMKMNLREIKDQLGKLVTSRQIVHDIQEKASDETQQIKTDSRKTNVMISGGSDSNQLNSVEKFCWSNKSWSPLQPMKERRQAASSFFFRNQIMVTGGWNDDHRSETMERVNINPVTDSERWFYFPVKLPATLCGHSNVVYDEKLIIIGGYDGKKTLDSIHEVLLVPPYTSELLTTMPKPSSFHGAQLFNDKILICGGRKTSFFPYDVDSLDSVIMYDISKNECKQISPLPYAVREMATVSWGDSVIVMGGADKNGKVLNTVVIYNVKTERSRMLPPMKYKRLGCVAVVVDNTIVVMGGKDERGNYLKSVESFRFDRYSWEDLPSMNIARAWATAVVC